MATQYIYDMLDTWNNGATTFTGVKLSVTDTASAVNSLLMDLQVGGSSLFRARKDGYVAASLSLASTSIEIFQNSSAALGRSGDRTAILQGVSNGGLSLPSSGSVHWSGGSTALLGSLGDTILSRRAAANLRLGAADAAAPVAQTLSVQSVVAGTTNTAGANLTITGSQGTGTGAGGSIVFQVAPAGSSGTAQNALATALTIAGSRVATFSAGVIFNDYVQAGTVGLNYYGSGQINLSSTSILGWGSAGLATAPDTILARDAANTLALRNGANAQTFRVYNTTDGTNSEFGRLEWASNVFRIGTAAAGTGSTTRTLELYASTLDHKGPAGSGYIRSINANTPTLEVVQSTGKKMTLTPIYQEFDEVTAPASPAADKVRIYAEDNGSGKTRLMALFPTGAAVQIAIEP